MDFVSFVNINIFLLPIPQNLPYFQSSSDKFFFLFLFQTRAPKKVNKSERSRTRHAEIIHTQRVPVHNVTPMLSAVNKLSTYRPTM